MSSFICFGHHTQIKLYFNILQTSKNTTEKKIKTQSKTVHTITLQEKIAAQHMQMICQMIFN